MISLVYTIYNDTTGEMLGEYVQGKNIIFSGSNGLRVRFNEKWWTVVRTCKGLPPEAIIWVV